MKIETAMNFALKKAVAASEKGEVPVAAVVLYDGKIIAYAHNECEISLDASAHAEMLAMQRASKQLNDWRLNDCTLIVNLEPCAMCAAAMANARLGRLIYGAYDPKYGACGSAMNLIDGILGWKVKHIGGVMESECKALLDSFFGEIR